MPLREGQPLAPGSEIVRVEEYEEDGWHDIETVYRVSDGPAQVATPAYRAGYDRILERRKWGSREMTRASSSDRRRAFRLQYEAIKTLWSDGQTEDLEKKY